MMKKTLLASTAIGSFLAAGTVAHAEGLGLRFFGGVNLAGDESIGPAFIGTDFGTTVPVSFGLSGTASVDPDLGYVFGGAVGYGWDNGVSIELEAAYRRHQIDVSGTAIAGYLTSAGFSTVASLTGHDTDGHMSALSLMANAWYEFDTGSSVRPYVGGGVGIAWVDIHDIVEARFMYAGTTIAYTSSFGAHGDDSGFAWQLGAGLAWEIAPGKDVTVEYRYFNGPEIEHVRIDALVHELDIDYNAHSVMAGFRVGY